MNDVLFVQLNYRHSALSSFHAETFLWKIGSFNETKGTFPKLDIGHQFCHGWFSNLIPKWLLHNQVSSWRGKCELQLSVAVGSDWAVLLWEGWETKWQTSMDTCIRHAQNSSNIPPCPPTPYFFYALAQYLELQRSTFATILIIKWHHLGPWKLSIFELQSKVAWQAKKYESPRTPNSYHT